MHYNPPKMNGLKFSYSQMRLLCQTLQPLTENSHCLGFFQKTSQEFYLLFRKNQKICALFFSFHSPLIGFYLASHFPKHLKPYEPLFSAFNEQIIQKIEILNQDRILKLTFQGSQKETILIAEFFNKHPNFYLIQSPAAIQWSLHPVSLSIYQPPSPVSFSSFEDKNLLSHQEIEEIYTREKLDQEKRLMTNQLNRQLKRLQLKIDPLNQALEKSHQWQKIQHEGELIKAYFASYPKGESQWWVKDWETNEEYCLVLDSLQTAQEGMKQRFRQAKKLQLSRSPLEKQIKITEQKIKQIEKSLEYLKTLTSLEEIDRLKEEDLPSSKLVSKKVPTETSKIYREYQSTTGIKIWVGRNAKANEALTFQLAKGNEWWMHVHQMPGSHVIIKHASEQPPDTNTLQDAMQLALQYSKAKDEAEICYTQRKYVSRLKKGQVGQVQVSKHYLSWVRKDKERYQALLERSSL